MYTGDVSKVIGSLSLPVSEMGCLLELFDDMIVVSDDGTIFDIMKDGLSIVIDGSSFNHGMHQGIGNKSFEEHPSFGVVRSLRILYCFMSGPHIKILIHRIDKVAARFNFLNLAKDCGASSSDIHGVI